MSTILELSVPKSVLTPLGEGDALFIIDYGIQLNSVWIVTLWETGDVIHVDSSEIRIAGNPMLDIPEPKPFKERKV